MNCCLTISRAYNRNKLKWREYVAGLPFKNLRQSYLVNKEQLYYDEKWN